MSVSHNMQRGCSGSMLIPGHVAGLEMLQQVAVVDCSYSMTPEELYAKVAQSDALIVRSATKVGCSRNIHDMILVP